MAGKGFSWLTECSAEALGEALRVAAPQLSRHPLAVPIAANADPLWHKASTVVGQRFVVKFAWSRPAALRMAREIGVLAALSRGPAVPFLPDVIAGSTDPVLLVTRRVGGRLCSRSPARLTPTAPVATWPHCITSRPASAPKPLSARSPDAELPPPTTAVLRERLPRWVLPDQRLTVLRGCDWANAVLAAPGRAVLVHGDLHGDNQVWDHEKLRLVADFETVGVAEPEYDLRAFPGPGMGPGVELLTALLRHYRQITGQRLDLERVMAWHLRNALGDVLWRSEAGIPLPDRRTPAQWVDDLAPRFRALGIDPQASIASSSSPR